MKRRHAYIIVWNDSTALRGWHPINSPEHKTSSITSIGWIIKQEPKTVTITTSISQFGNVMDALSIPRNSIKRMKRLRPFVLGDE